MSIQRGRARSIYRAAYTAGYPPFSERHPVGGRVSILRDIIVFYPPSTRLRRGLYSSRFDEYRVLYLSVFSYVYTLISSILSTQGRGRVGLLLLLRIYRVGAIAQFAKLSITIHSAELTADVFARRTGHGLDLLLLYILIYRYDIICRGRSVQYKNQAVKRVLDHYCSHPAIWARSYRSGICQP